MPVTVHVTFDELPEKERGPFPYSANQNATIESLAAEYRDEVVKRLSKDQREHQEDSRHLWYNKVLVEHKGRFLYDVSTAASVDLNFCRDSYLVSTPRVTDVEGVINPELTVSEVLKEMQLNKQEKYKLYASICCYEVFVKKRVLERGRTLEKDRVLEPNKTLYEQGVWPYVEEDKRGDSHLHIRFKASMMRKVYGLLWSSALLGAITGGVLGWISHHFSRS